jgi:hypothetical protein
MNTRIALAVPTAVNHQQSKIFTMKKLSIILTTLIFLTACTAQEKQEDIFLQIASSQEYAQYKAAVYGRAALISQNQVDLDAISLILEMNQNAENVETIGKDAFSQIRGGVMWYEYAVEYGKRIKELDAKYQYLSIPTEERSEIAKLYEQITGGKEKKQLRDAAFQYLQNRQK